MRMIEKRKWGQMKRRAFCYGYDYIVSFLLLAYFTSLARLFGVCCCGLEWTLDWQVLGEENRFQQGYQETLLFSFGSYLGRSGVYG